MNDYWRREGDIAEGVRYEIILTYVKQLVEKLGGVRPAVNSEHLREMYLRKDFLAMICFIRDTMSLGNNFRVGWVNRGGPPKAPAWIKLLVDSPMPIYGSEAFQNTTFNLYVRKSFLREAPFESIVQTLAHEISHIVIHSIGAADQFELKEEATDLAAMILGYRDFYRKGHVFRFDSFLEKTFFFLWHLFGEKKYGYIYKVGYLSEEEVNFAANLMDESIANF